jgi:hypothetical protein
MKNHAGSSLDCLFLIPENFDNQLVLQVLGSFREAGLASALVSLTPGLIKSAGGVRVRADFAIDQLPETTLPRLIFILENEVGATALLADPHVRQLIEKTLTNKGRLVILAEAQGKFQAAGFSEAVLVPELAKTRPLILREIIEELVSWVKA